MKTKRELFSYVYACTCECMCVLFSFHLRASRVRFMFEYLICELWPEQMTVMMWFSRKGCHRCLVIYEKHKNVLQYKESECEGDSLYMHQSNPSAMAMRSVLNQKNGDHRGGAHPNLNGHSRLSSSDQYIMRSNDDMNDCKHFLILFKKTTKH